MRLINADELRNYWLNNGANEPVYCANDFLDSIDHAPTISFGLNWTSVKESLPPASGDYFVFLEYGSYDVISYSAKYKSFNCIDSLKERFARKVANHDVTHWAPLPMDSAR